MTAPRTESLQSRLETLIALARLLERVEASPIAIGADQVGGAWTLLGADLHPFALLFALSGTLMISKTLRIPKL